MNYSTNIVISFFVFITMGFYTWSFNGARQGIACAIYSLAIGQMLKRNFLKYVGYVLLAFLFHKTAIMTLPMYFVFNRPNSFKNNLFTIVLGFAAVMFIDSIIGVASSLDTRYAVYGTAGEGGGYILFGFDIVLSVFFLIFRNSIRSDRYQYDRFLNMFLFGVMITAVSTILNMDPSGLRRYNAYFDLGIIFMWPIVFKNINDRLPKFIIGYLFIIGYIIFFTMTTERFSDLVPYRFNSSFIFFK